MARKKNELTSNQKAEAVVRAINAKYGTKVMKHPTEARSYRRGHLPTGSLLLDLALGYSPYDGRWGWPEFCAIEIIGDKGTGKTNFCLEAAKRITNNGGMVCFIDSEHALDEPRLKIFDLYESDNFFIVNPETGTQSWDLLLELMASGIYSLIIFDSLATVTSKAEDEEESLGTKKTMGGSAFLNNKAVRKIHGTYCRLANKYDNNEDIVLPTILVTNQHRMTFDLFSKPTSPGGEGRKYMDLVTVSLTELPGKDNIYTKEYTLYDEEGEKIAIPKKFSKLMGMSQAFGVTVKFEITKNKAGIPHGSGRYVLLLSEVLNHKAFDIFTEKEIVLALLRKGVIVPAAKGWLSYQGNNYREDELLVAFSKDLDKYVDIVYKLYGEEIIPDNIFDNFDDLICTSCGEMVTVDEPCNLCGGEEGETRITSIKREAVAFALECAKSISVTSQEGFGIEEELAEFIEDEEEEETDE